MNLLFIGDIFGRPGRRIILEQLSSIKKEFSTDICLANCENAAAGKGVTEKIIKQLRDAGIDAFTAGNHLWDNKGSWDYLQQEKRIAKPFNYPRKSIGASYCTIPINEKAVTIVTFVGQAFMPSANSPFEQFDDFYGKVADKADIIVVDIHAEATAEKKAFACYLDGKVSCILGSHTHVQTADEQILEKGTGFITDVGMTGPHDSVIGVKKEIILEKMLTGMPRRYEVAKDGLELNAVSLKIDEKSGKTLFIERIKRKY